MSTQIVYKAIVPTPIIILKVDSFLQKFTSFSYRKNLDWKKIDIRFSFRDDGKSNIHFVANK